MQKTSFKIFCLSTEKFRCGTLRYFKKFWLSKNFMHQKGISLFYVEIFLSHRTEKLRTGTLLCFRKFLVWKKLWMRGGGGGGGGSSRFSVEIFCLTVLNNIVGEPFCVSKNLGYRKLLCIIG